MRLPTLFSWMWGRRVVDRGAGLSPSFVPAPVPTRDENFGLTICPSCGWKCSVLVDGVCRDCHPKDAA